MNENTNPQPEPTDAEVAATLDRVFNGPVHQPRPKRDLDWSDVQADGQRAAEDYVPTIDELRTAGSPAPYVEFMAIWFKTDVSRVLDAADDLLPDETALTVSAKGAVILECGQLTDSSIDELRAKFRDYPAND